MTKEEELEFWKKELVRYKEWIPETFSSIDTKNSSIHYCRQKIFDIEHDLT